MRSEVQLFPDPPYPGTFNECSNPKMLPFIVKGDVRGSGAVAQLGEHLVCNQEVTGSSPVSSTIQQRTQKLFSRATFDPFVGALFNNLE